MQMYSQRWLITLTFQYHSNMKELKSKEGYYLTQAADVVEEDRVFVTAIKGENVNEADWREATAEEKEEFEKALAEKIAENIERLIEP